MPEVAEVAHVCAQLRRNILGHRIKSVLASNDPLIFPFLKLSTDPDKELSTFQNALTGCSVSSIGRHGKYFWMRLQPRDKSSLVLLMHFGMTGMVKLRNINSHLIFMENGGDKKRLDKLKQTEKEPSVADEEVTWPPKFTKFEMTFEDGDNQVEFAFVDPRRLARIRLLTGDSIQNDLDLLNHPPLDVLGPDYSKPRELLKQEQFTMGDPDPDNHGRPRLTLAEFNKLILTKKKPIKSLLLDQNCFAGVGNWVADEILFNARIHPAEVISNKIDNVTTIHPVIERLYENLVYVCETAVKVEGNVDHFPKHWLMLHRWGKSRKKEKPKTNDGYLLDYVTVGGRTSCYSPELQKMLKQDSKIKATTDKQKFPQGSSKECYIWSLGNI
ncbi:uncharacterized protein SPAPADRAFT_57196 [Spathaspora passalidarum NRRL Y-27907]|uniref:Formamidopyrimidine-DNA glycosylase catalytic domain-containing protein n=1 Tax=Spathaspora passalidarum (strain NRRL Y-27907 / 11-Y1) TaxID=619300 RepID=G3AU29_SPAPN|nr:uncharacterized protein SPAPADRAFT_57196 [Spathaspora passalidarum NRRL Y-27907]EGW30405.1 hypothetical protein SPAPADRAFT_57196 [Spathaspora passalidarum NRRL Y-27907]